MSDSDSAADEFAGGRGGGDASEAAKRVFEGCTDAEVPEDKAFEMVIVFEDVTAPTEKDDDGNEVPVSTSSSKYKSWLEMNTKRKELEQQICDSRVGLKVTKKAAADKKKIYLLITAGKDRLAREADRVDLTMRLKESYGGGFAPYDGSLKEMFAVDDPKKPFGGKQRIFLVRSILEGVEDGCARVRLEKNFRDGIISKYFPMHEREKKRKLVEEWASIKKIAAEQPLQDIRNYFGEEIAMYFAWLGFYTHFLFYASVVGIVAFIAWLVAKLSEEEWGLWVNTGYSIYLALWATVFLEFWKRKQNELAQRWGMSDFEETEEERADFKGERQEGLYWKGEWLTPADYSVLKGHPKKMGNVNSQFKTNAKALAAGPVLALLLGVVFMVTAAVLIFRLIVQNVNDLLGSAVGGFTNAIAIIIMNVVGELVAHRLTRWENHRTETAFRDNLIVKIFIFQFCNSYASFYYLAFFKRSTRFFGDDNLSDGCRTQWGAKPRDTIAGACVDELTMQVISILLTNMIVGQAREVLLPWVMAKLQSIMFIRNMLNGLNPSKDNMDEYKEGYKSLPAYEREALRVDWPGTFEEYSEMVIQYGYITLFAAVFPLAPLLALLNNIIEIRTDATKMLHSHNRPHYQGAQDIGPWYGILDWIGYAAVLTNCLLIGFSYSPLYNLLDEDAFRTFTAIVILEHVLLLLKWAIAFVIPDVPEEVAHEQAVADYIKFYSFKSARKAGTAMLTSRTDYDDDDDASSVEEIVAAAAGASAADAVAVKKGKKGKKEVADDDTDGATEMTTEESDTE